MLFLCRADSAQRRYAILPILASTSGTISGPCCSFLCLFWDWRIFISVGHTHASCVATAMFISVSWWSLMVVPVRKLFEIVGVVLVFSHARMLVLMPSRQNQSTVKAFRPVCVNLYCDVNQCGSYHLLLFIVRYVSIHLRFHLVSV